MRQTVRTGAAVLAIAALLSSTTATPAAGAASDWHEDTRCGFKVKPPRSWEQVPLQIDEGWQVAKYLSDRDYFWTDKATGWTYEHKPRMIAIAFVERPDDEDAAKKKGEGKGDEVVVVITNPYRDYKDYLKRTYSDGGYYVAEEAEAELDGLQVTQLEIKVERGTHDGPKRIATWIYHLEGLDLAVEFEVLETEWDKLEKTVVGSLKSLRTVPRVAGALPGNESLAERIFSYAEMDDLSPFDRRVKRQELEQQLHEKARLDLPDGWTVQDEGRFLVLNHCSDSVGERMVERAAAVMDFLDQRFDYIGREEYVRRPILRICKTSDEEWSYRKGGDGYWSINDLEIVTHDDQMGSSDSYEGEWVNGRVVSLWFNDRDRDLFWAFPAWLAHGMGNAFGTAVPKRRKLEFRKDDWDREELRQRVREGSVMPPREMLVMGREDFYDNDVWDRQREAGALVRFFLSGDAKKSSKTRDVLDDYIKNLKLVVSSLGEDDPKAKDERKPKTEEEEDAYFRKRKEAWQEKERQILEEVFERTFRSWSDKDWEAFDKVYFKSIK